MPMTHGRPRLHKSLLLTAAIALAGVTSLATAGPRRGPPRILEERALEAAGCYFYRGRQFCGRYCYYEINGRRYCQRREREAHTQADPALDSAEPGPTLK